MPKGAPDDTYRKGLQKTRCIGLPVDTHTQEWVSHLNESSSLPTAADPQSPVFGDSNVVVDTMVRPRLCLLRSVQVFRLFGCLFVRIGWVEAGSLVRVYAFCPWKRRCLVLPSLLAGAILGGDSTGAWRVECWHQVLGTWFNECPGVTRRRVSYRCWWRVLKLANTMGWALETT